MRLRGKRSRLRCRRQDSNLRLSELALCATIRPSSTAEVRLHIAGLSRLSPLRVGCLRLAPIGTRFCFLLALYPRKPVPACTSPERWIWRRRLDSNQRHTSWRGALPTELRLHEGGARLSEPPANHVMAHRRFYVSRVLSVPKHTCSKENLRASLLGTSPCVRNYNIEA